MCVCVDLYVCRVTVSYRLSSGVVYQVYQEQQKNLVMAKRRKREKERYVIYKTGISCSVEESKKRKPMRKSKGMLNLV